MDLTKVPILIVPLMEGENVSTNGNGTWATRKVSPKELANLGPYLAGLRVHAKLSGKSDQFRFRVIAEWSVDRSGWTECTNPLLGTQTADGSVIGSEYTNSSEFGIYLRISVQVSNNSGSAIESGTLSVYLVYHFLS